MGHRNKGGGILGNLGHLSVSVEPRDGKLDGVRGPENVSHSLSLMQEVAGLLRNGHSDGLWIIQCVWPEHRDRLRRRGK